MSLATPQLQRRPDGARSRSQNPPTKMGDGGQTRSRSTSVVDRQSSSSYSVGGSALRTTSTGGSSHDSGGSGNGGGGILCNAHEAPRRSSKNDSAIRSALKAAFIPQQPGKQMKANGKPLGKTFHRTEPLPQRHAGAEVLKVDPRGADATVGDGIVLGSPSSESSLSLDSAGKGIEDSKDGADYASAEEDVSSMASSERLSPSFNEDDQPTGNRARSGTASTQLSDTPSSSNSSVPCSIKFAPLPTSGRLKRANSITIGVAARSQLLHSQGAGRQQSNAQQWQAAQNQMRAQQQQQRSAPLVSASAADTVDLGDEIRKGCKKAWSRVRRGSSVTQSEEDSSSRQKQPSNLLHDVVTEDDSIASAGEKTPMRSHSPVDGGEQEADGARTPRRQSMQRRTSTGAFIGQASFMSMEEKRKRGQDGNRNGEQEREQGDVERENEATRFIEMLGQTGSCIKSFHLADDDDDRQRGRQQSAAPIKKEKDGDKVVEVVKHYNDGNGGRRPSSRDSASTGNEEFDEDDEEAREAERLADAALKGHSAKANQAGAVEKMEKKPVRSSGGRA